MTTENNKQDSPQAPLLTQLQRIKDGTLDPASLDVDTRKELAWLLRNEGYSKYQISQIFGCTEKTIYRYIKKKKEEIAKSTSPEFVKATVGEFVYLADQHWQALVRAARLPSASIPEKINGELAAWKVIVDKMITLQSLGYLPLRPKEIKGEFLHQVNQADEEKTLLEVKTMVIDIEKTAKENGVLTPELEQEINDLNMKVEKAEIIYQVNKISEEQKLLTKRKEDSDE
ncbi:MAG: helix-turn-helix domain-containing protein [Candidatus Omnitrophica bacterium]|nr:helix-turn-helix domain-containing protein [Candidatus Omnitrophota bacterium]